MNPKLSLIVPVYNVEEYIPNFIKSVLNQTYKDFEVIFINDGPQDNCEEIISNVDDKRIVLINQQNQGVSSARNKGIENAKGKYLMFADPDDILPCQAMESLVNKIENSKSDLVVGILESNELGFLKQSSVKLAEKDKIGHFNRALLWSFTVCNKIFKTSIVKDNNIKFENICYCEDGVFLFNYLRYANKIVGCNNIVYNYLKRDFTKDRSASQNMDLRYATENKEVLEKIKLYTCEYAKKYLEEAINRWGEDSGYYKERQVAILRFGSELYRRMAHYNILYRFYRNIWLLKDDTCEFLENLLIEWQNKMFPSDWKRIVSNNKDIFINEKIINKKYLSNKPVFTFVVKDMEQKTLTMWLDNLYFQKFPSFEVIVGCDVPDKYMSMENIKKSNGKISNKDIKGEYIVEVDLPIYFMQDTLIDLYKELTSLNKEFDVISLPLKKIENNKLKILALFDNEMKYFDCINQCININKIYKRDIYINQNKNGEEIRLETPYFISELDDTDLISQVKSIRAKREYKKIMNS